MNASGLSYDVQPYKSMRFVGPFELRTVKIPQVVLECSASLERVLRADTRAQQMFPNAEPSVTQLSDFQTWLSAAKDEEASRNADYAGRSDSDVTLLSHLHSLLTSSEGQVPSDKPLFKPAFRFVFDA